MCLGPELILWDDLSKGRGTWDFGTCSVKSLYRAGTLTAAVRKVARYESDLVGVQEVRWDKGGTVRAGDCIFIHGKETKINWKQDFFVHHRTVSTVTESIEFVSDRMWYTGWFKKMDSISCVYISWTIQGMWKIYITYDRGGPKFSNTTGWMLKRRRNARCTAVADSVLINSRTQKILWTQKILCCIVAILLSTNAAARLCARRAL